MKTISLRQFRDSVADLEEAVQVVKREGSEVRTLGTWLPFDPPQERVAVTGGIAGFGHSSPAPKGGKK